MKSKEEIDELAEEFLLKHQEGSKVYHVKIREAIEFAYTQCQEDMADKKYTEEDMKNSIKLADEYADFKMTQLANHLRNNYQPLAPNQAEWQRISDKKVFRIEEIIEELKK